MKAIALIRTSTDRQNREDQKKEVIEVITGDGYSLEDIIVVGDEAGASAIKVDDRYLANMQKVYDLIETGEIEAVYAWAIDRIGRDRTQLNQFRETLLRKKVQLVIKNPSLRLLNPDGTENTGIGLAFALFAEMAVQEMEQKKARFHKGRKTNAELGKYNGGYICYGYKIDQKGFYVINEPEAEVVRKIFEKMSSDKYSLTSLTEELREEGVIFNNRLINYQMVMGILKNTAYIGYRDKYVFNHKYPRIISDDLWKKTHEVMRNNNSTKSKASKHYTFANLLIKCPECGRSYVAQMSKEHYRCSAHAAPKIRKAMGEELCGNDLTISMSNLDGFLWSFAKDVYRRAMRGKNAVRRAEMESEIASLEKKIKESPNLFKEIKERYERVDEVYMSGRMTKERYSSQISAIKIDEDKIKEKVLGWEEEIKRLKEILEDKGDKHSWINSFLPLTEIEQQENEKKMYDFIHSVIKSVRLERVIIDEDLTLNLEKEDGTELKYKLKGRKAVKITATPFEEDPVTVYFVSHIKHLAMKIFYFKNGEVIPFFYEKILRGENGYATTEKIEAGKELVNAINDLKWEPDELLKLIEELPKYGASYTGDFSGEKAAEVKKAYNRVHSYRDFQLTVTTLSHALRGSLPADLIPDGLDIVLDTTTL